MRCPDPSDLASFAAHSARPSRLDMLEGHVADCANCRRLVFALALDAPPPEVAEQRIGRFVVEDTIGAGAMGVVYRAHDPELDRKVAIKVHAHHSRLALDADERLRREAQALARLSHPNVVAVYEAGRHADTTFVAMELVDGLTLEDWLPQPRRLADVLDVFEQIARGLAAAHDAGLVHRDIKPRNVFVCGSTNTAKIGDFGLVRAATSPSLAAAPPTDLTLALSVDGALVGTPAYMAPEQLRGEPATAASDQFSFCVMLHEALFGTRPFVGATMAELLHAMERGSPRRATRAPRRVHAVLARGLALDPQRRFSSMTALLAALHPRARPWLPAAGVAVVAAGVLAGFAATRERDFAADCELDSPAAIRAFSPDRIGAVAFTMAAKRSPSARLFADIAARDLAAYGARWRATSVAVCHATTTKQQSVELGERQRACLDRRAGAVEQLGLQLARLAPERLASVAEAIASLSPPEPCGQVQIGEIAPPPVAMTVAVDALERRLDRIMNLRILGQEGVARAELAQALAQARLLRYGPLLSRALFVASDFTGDDADAHVAQLHEAAREAARAHADDRLANILTTLAFAIGVEQARPQEAMQLLPVAEAALLRAGDGRTARWLFEMVHATILDLAGHTDEAVRVLEAILVDTSGIPEFNVATAHNNLAGYLEATGHSAGAERHIAAALELYRAEAGGTDAHPSAVMTLINMSMFTSDPATAIAYLDRARAAAERILPPDHHYFAAIEDQLGAIAMQQERFADAVLHHGRALERYRATLGDEDLRTALSLGNLGEAEGHAGDPAGGAAHLARSVEMAARATSPTHIAVGKLRINLGKALAVAGDRRAARQELEAGLALVPVDDDFAVEARNKLAELARRR